MKIKYLIPIILVSILSSCDLDRVNENPNSPTKVPATNILGTTFVQGYFPVFDSRVNCYYAGAFSGMVCAMDYEYRNDINNNLWNSYYSVMRTCIDVMRVSKIDENNNLYAAGLTMKAFYAIKATDMWGDIPYSEAFRIGDKILHPKYDKQKDVYIQILNELKEAADLFDPQGKNLGIGDFLYGGNPAKWQKFCNSLRLRAAIRAASGEEAVGLPTIKEIAGDPVKYPVIASNSDNAYWNFPGIAPDEERWYRENIGYKDKTGYKTSKWRSQQPLVDALVDNNDPRTPVYLEKNKQGKYNGFKFGFEQNTSPKNRIDSTSAFGDRFCGDPSGFMPLMNSAEVSFCLAEAALKGYIAGGESAAKQYYEEGITKSCVENGIKQDQINEFLNQIEINWNTGTSSKMDKIALQKWICLFKQSVEAWSEVRRTDVPKILNIDDMYMHAHNRPPLRLHYSVSEETLNENFPKDIVVVDIFYGTQVWWDKRVGVR